MLFFAVSLSFVCLAVCQTGWQRPRAQLQIGTNRQPRPPPQPQGGLPNVIPPQQQGQGGDQQQQQQMTSVLSQQGNNTAGTNTNTEVYFVISEVVVQCSNALLTDTST